MDMRDVRRQIEYMWLETEPYWMDEVSVKYKKAAIERLIEITNAMQSSCFRINMKGNDILDRLNRINQREEA